MTATAEKKTDWATPLEPKFSEPWKPEEPGDHIIGKVKKITREKSQYGEGWLLHLVTDEGDKGIWLTGGLVGHLEHFQDGGVFRIEYAGTEDTGKGNPMKTYIVQRAKK